MNCKGFCTKYLVKPINLKKIGRYENGQKLCSSCSIYIHYKGTKCPCCGNNLRTKPRNSLVRNKHTGRTIFRNLQENLTLSDETIHYSKKLFSEIKNKIPFCFQSKTVVISTCVFIAAKFKHEPKSIKKISDVSDVKKDLLELTCVMALDDLREVLVKT